MYREAFYAIGTTDLAPMISGIPAISAVFNEGDTAQYYFDQVVDGETITFPINFVKENGVWKISSY
jgi:hypothetical protein